MKTHSPRYERSLLSGSLSLVLSLCLSSGVFAQDWLVVDTFDGGQAQATWVHPNPDFAADLVLDFSADTLFFRNISPIRTLAVYTELPQAVSSGTATIYLDFYLPPGQVQNQVGFGAGSLAQVQRGAWNSAGSHNRFQAANAHPQILVKAWDVDENGKWTNDVLDPTLQAVWYNIWLVYNLDTQRLALYHRRADAESMDAQLGGEWAFDLRANGDDLSTISHFALGAGTLEVAIEGFSALGGVIDNLYMSVGENLTLPPTARIELPPEWQAIDTFAGAPQANWKGQLDHFGLDFSEGYLAMRPTSSTSRSNIYVDLPQVMVGGRFTLTFDLFVEGASNQRTDIGFAAVSDTQIVLSGVDQRGGNDRFGTVGANPQSLIKIPASSPLLIPGADLQGRWHHVWLYYDLATKVVEFYTSALGQEPDPDSPAGSFALGNEYPDFRYFVIGIDRSSNPGLNLGNLYFASDRLIKRSPTAGVFDPDGDLLPGVYEDALLGIHEYLGSGWSAWYGLEGSTYQGMIWTGLRPPDSAGWIYHVGMGRWYYVVDSGEYAGGLLYLQADNGIWKAVSDAVVGQYWSYASGAWENWFP